MNFEEKTVESAYGVDLRRKYEKNNLETPTITTITKLENIIFCLCRTSSFNE